MLAAFVCAPSLLHAQDGFSINMPYYDKRPVHYGFQIGIFRANFNLKYSDHFAQTLPDSMVIARDSIMAVNPVSSPGFSLGMIVNFAMNKGRWDFRLTPNVAFFERTVEYMFNGGSTFSTINQATFIEMPFMLKYKSERRKNRRLYLTGGLIPSLQVGGRKDVNEQQNLMIERFNVEAAYGVGAHFYMKMFNFAPELRFSHGFMNALTQNYNLYSRQLERITTHKITLLINFEG